MATKDDTDDEKKALFGGLTDEQRADMTDEELAGIDGEEDDDEGDGDEGDADAAAGDDADKSEPDEDKSKDDDDDSDGDDDEDEADGESDDEDEGDKPTDDDKPEEAGNDAGEPDEDADDVAADDDEEDDLDVTRSVMPTEWQLPKDIDEKLADFKKQAADLAEKFDGGDLSAKEYHEQREAIDEQRNQLRTQKHDAQQAWNKALGDWSNRTVRAFLREHKEYSDKNPTLNRMLDGEVRALQVNSPDPFNPRILRQAHANIQKAMGKEIPERPGKKATSPSEKGKGKDKTPVVPGKKPQVPPTLARVPQDEIEDAEGGKFARLDRLSSKDPHAFEEAMMRMSAKDKAAYDEYLAGA